MQIRELTLMPFRNFAHHHFQLGRKGSIVIAPNGSGKSNVLEAISYLSIGKSVRGVRDREAVPHGGEHFEIRGVWHDGRRERQLRICFVQGQGKKAFVDGVPLDRVSDLVSLFQTVHFCPEDVSLVLRFAAQRRRLLDILISQSNTGYLHDLQRFQRALAQRNQCLKRWQPAADMRRELEPWDALIIEYGSLVRRQRLQMLANFEPVAAECYRRFSAGRETLSLAYLGISAINFESDELPTQADLCSELRDELCQARERERQAGHTRCGPHRDTLSFELDGEPAETYASQGQLKSILVAWKIAELRFLEKTSGQQPVLLLDDVFSEFDADRARELMDSVKDFDQVVLTAPRPLYDELPGCFAEIDLTDESDR